MFLLLFTGLSFLIIEISSATVINNVTATVNSDILKEIFFKEIQINEQLDIIIEQESLKYDSKKCFLSLREIIRRFQNKEVFPFIDAWGHLPSGLVYGNIYDTGEFDQCVSTSVYLNELTGVVNGQYCFVSLALPKTLNGVKTGICIPDTCSPEYMTSVFKSSSDKLLNGTLTEIISVEYCTDGKFPPLSTINIVTISIFSVVTTLMILSSFYEFFSKYYEKTAGPILSAFSILTNGKKLFAITTNRSRNNIECFNGMRVLSTFWIMIHHITAHMRIMNNIPMIEFLQLRNSLLFMPFVMATSAVDSFFFIGGLLVAFNGFQNLDKTNGKINLIMNIVQRYIRLTPIVAVGLLFYYGIHEQLFSTGPFKDIAMETNHCDGSNWWPNLLFIQNYYFTEKLCYLEAWYLAVDFQLYILSPLLLIPMWKWGKKIIYAVGILIVASTSYVMAVFFIEEYTAFTPGINVDEWEKIYVPTHARWNPWLIGFVLGYFMHYNRQTDFYITKWVQLLSWIVSLTIMIAVVYGPFPAFHAYGKGTVFEAAMYGGFKSIAWTGSLVWITFACYYGYGGVVDTLLSHPIWQPLSRLSYALYMMHMAVMKIHFAISRRTPLHFSVYNCLLYFWSIYGETLLLSIYVTLAFESPILVLGKFIFGGTEPKTKQEETLPHRSLSLRRRTEN